MRMIHSSIMLDLRYSLETSPTYKSTKISLLSILTCLLMILLDKGLLTNILLFHL